MVRRLRRLPEVRSCHCLHGVNRQVNYDSAAAAPRPSATSPAAADPRAWPPGEPHRVLEQAVNQRAPRHAGVGAMRGRVGADHLRRVVGGRIRRARHARDVARLGGDGRDRPRRLTRSIVRGDAGGVRLGLRLVRRVERLDGWRRRRTAAPAALWRLPRKSFRTPHALCLLIARPAADDQQLARAGGGDIEQPIVLGLAVRLLRLLRAAPSRRARREASPLQTCPRTSRTSLNQPCAFEPFRSMCASTRGMTPPSGSARNTTLASSPFALCRFITPDDVGAARLERKRLDLVRPSLSSSSASAASARLPPSSTT